MRNQKSNLYLMGQTESKLLLDCSFHQMPFTKRTSPPCSAWEHTKAKNFDYYFKRPTTHISRKNYRWYERGYIYGYNYIPIEYGEETEKENNQIEDIPTEIERAF